MMALHEHETKYKEYSLFYLKAARDNALDGNVENTVGFIDEAVDFASKVYDECWLKKFEIIGEKLRMLAHVNGIDFSLNRAEYLLNTSPEKMSANLRNSCVVSNIKDAEKYNSNIADVCDIKKRINSLYKQLYQSQ